MAIEIMEGDIVTDDDRRHAPSESLAVALQRAEIDQQVSTAKAYPRSIRKVQTSILNLAILDEESAEECQYALPRGGKPIMGPSIRFAEILKQSFGNCSSGARVVHVDRVEMYVEAEGVFHDLETNSRSTRRVRRRISNKYGKILTDDMIIVTGNAACSIAERNAILGGVPKPLWRGAYDAVIKTIAGDVETLTVKRGKALAAFAVFGVKPDQVFAALDVGGEADITVDHIPVIRGMYSALKNGEATVEEMFARPTKQVDADYNPLNDAQRATKRKPGAALGVEVTEAGSGGGGGSSPIVQDGYTGGGHGTGIKGHGVDKTASATTAEAAITAPVLDDLAGDIAEARNLDSIMILESGYEEGLSYESAEVQAEAAKMFDAAKASLVEA